MSSLYEILSSPRVVSREREIRLYAAGLLRMVARPGIDVEALRVLDQAEKYARGELSTEEVDAVEIPNIYIYDDGRGYINPSRYVLFHAYCILLNSSSALIAKINKSLEGRGGCFLDYCTGYKGVPNVKMRQRALFREIFGVTRLKQLTVDPAHSKLAPL